MGRFFRFLIFLVAAVALIFMFRKTTNMALFRRAEPVTNTYSFSEEIKDLEIDVSECNVILKKGGAGPVKVICREADTIVHDVKVSGSTLVIRRRRDVSVTGVTISNIKLEIEISLPETAYGNADISTSSGDIRVAEGIVFDDASFRTSSGDIITSADVRNSFTCRSSSGDQEISGCSPALLAAGSSSGDITLSGLRGKEIGIETSSGRITVADTVISGQLEAETSSGGVMLDRADAASIRIKSSSGDVTGTVLSSKTFRTKTSSGNVSVPGTSGGGECEITTSSGDIKITIG